MNPSDLLRINGIKMDREEMRLFTVQVAYSIRRLIELGYYDSAKRMCDSFIVRMKEEE